MSYATNAYIYIYTETHTIDKTRHIATNTHNSTRTNTTLTQYNTHNHNKHTQYNTQYNTHTITHTPTHQHIQHTNTRNTQTHKHTSNFAIFVAISISNSLICISHSSFLFLTFSSIPSKRSLISFLVFSMIFSFSVIFCSSDEIISDLDLSSVRRVSDSVTRLTSVCDACWSSIIFSSIASCASLN